MTLGEKDPPRPFEAKALLRRPVRTGALDQGRMQLAYPGDERRMQLDYPGDEGRMQLDYPGA